MCPARKVWVIEANTSGDPWGRASAKSREARPREEAQGFGAYGSPLFEKAPSRRSARHIVLAYTLGPLTLLAFRRSAVRLIWAALGLGSMVAWSGFLANRSELLNRAQASGLGVLPLMAGLSLVTLIGFISWGLAVFEAGHANRFVKDGIRAPLFNPGIVTALGLLLPGFGLLLTGHPRRAGWAMGMMGPLVAAATILTHSTWLLQLNRSRDSRIPGRDIELILLVSLLIALVAALVWLVQSLEGARYAARLTGRSSQGGPFALALVIALVAFIFAFNPVMVAQNLDSLAAAMRFDGLKVIPLCMEIGAMRLDPSIPLYPAHVAELYEELGRPETARSIRNDLLIRWKPIADLERKGGATREKP